jgi:photosystem II stability/assembly factor-like uncharacterized protein
VEDLNLRLEFHRALDAVTPPAPWLADNVRRALRDRYGDAHSPHRPAIRPVRPGWLLPLVATLLAVAIVAALIAGARELRPHPIPVKQPPIHGPAGVNCPTWSPLASLQYGPVPEKMTNPLSGWAHGDLRTNDGGRTWHDVTPASFRSDVSSATGAEIYPPGYADFFLDVDHAWLARPYLSTKSCFDHITVFLTSDGGQTWHASSPMPVAMAGDTQLQVQLDFIDPKHGWLMAIGGGRLLADSFLYATQDGGRSWRLVSQLPSALTTCGLQFSSPETGWLGACGDPSGGGPTIELDVTHDGGVTWTVQEIPAPPGGCGCSAPIDLTFIDANTGMFLIDGNTGYAVYVTTDGGASWLVSRGLTSGPVTIDFVDIGHLWALVPEPGVFTKFAHTWLYESSDQGAHWTLVQKDVPVSLYGASLQFVDPSHGFVVQPDPSNQAGSQVLVTTDAGHVWTVIKPEVK